MSDARPTEEMTPEEPAPEEPTTEEPTTGWKTNEKRTTRRLRDDPLSVFLGVAALVLGLMYVVESRQQSVLERQELRAAHIAQEAGLARSPACRVGTAGATGEVLVVACRDQPTEMLEADVRARLQDGWPQRLLAEGFERVAVHGRDGRRIL